MEERKSVPYPLYAQKYMGSVPIGIEPVFMLAFPSLSGKEVKNVNQMEIRRRNSFGGRS